MAQENIIVVPKGWKINVDFYNSVIARDGSFKKKNKLKEVYRLSTKLKQKYNVYHVNNLKSTVQFSLK